MLAAFLLSACAVGPDFSGPATAAGDAQSYTPQPLPDTTAAAPVAGGDAQHFVMGRDIPFAWWKEFGSPKLDALVEQALKNNPSITAAEASLRQAQELMKAPPSPARLLPYPCVSGISTPPARRSPATPPQPARPGCRAAARTICTYRDRPRRCSTTAWPTTTACASNSASTSAPDIFGGNRRKVESLLAQAESQRFQMEATYVTLVDNMVGAAIQEAALQAQIKATQAYIDQNRKALDILRKQQQLGYAMGIDVANQESALAQAEQQLPPLHKQLEQTHDLVRALLGELPNQEVDTAFDFDSLKLPQDLPLSLPSKLVEQRPDVRAAEEQWHEASANVGVAVAAELPQFTISGALGGNASELRQIFSPGAGFWNIEGDLAQTIFDGGTLLHRARRRPGPDPGGRAVPRDGDHRLPERRRHAARHPVRRRLPGGFGPGGAGRPQDPHRHRAAVQARLRQLPGPAQRAGGLPAGACDPGPGAGQPLRRYRGPVPGLGRRLVEPAASGIERSGAGR